MQLHHPNLNVLANLRPRLTWMQLVFSYVSRLWQCSRFHTVSLTHNTQSLSCYTQGSFLFLFFMWTYWRKVSSLAFFLIRSKWSARASGNNFIRTKLNMIYFINYRVQPNTTTTEKLSNFCFTASLCRFIEKNPVVQRLIDYYISAFQIKINCSTLQKINKRVTLNLYHKLFESGIDMKNTLLCINSICHPSRANLVL